MPFKIAPRMLTFLEKHAGDSGSTGICNFDTALPTHSDSQITSGTYKQTIFVRLKNVEFKQPKNICNL